MVHKHALKTTENHIPMQSIKHLCTEILMNGSHDTKLRFCSSSSYHVTVAMCMDRVVSLLVCMGAGNIVHWLHGGAQNRNQLVLGWQGEAKGLKEASHN